VNHLEHPSRDRGFESSHTSRIALRTALCSLRFPAP
jgi:hypothetical protein